MTAPIPPTGRPHLPAYLREVYAWAYLSRWGRRLFDRPVAVHSILLGNAARLMGGVERLIAPGARVLQIACVYGDFSRRLARRAGALEVIDAAAVQVRGVRRKLAEFPHARARRHDATLPFAAHFDTVVCFFLLHEVPDACKRRIVDNALAAVAPGGFAVFVDYHRPARWHPARPLIATVFRLLEPFAATLWQRPIASFASHAQDWDWQQRTVFGGLYQQVIARRRSEP
ncbi:rhodoquinone biosynthesis methyltransferase RquA [Plasticicumulans acidivorans]|uniref:Methyltransferase family protein n=1 Tax=Plasticicumulans acidivorans TaxID=886464 RepID=A0A317MSJ8_9GAMM|nr:rhodoquinone biosynthesis methyltransferase RquA [Plasticicumulans acidivorans]PWV60150.1 methyltransferase family protein [Plasticicumulans acidivorans]